MFTLMEVTYQNSAYYEQSKEEGLASLIGDLCTKAVIQEEEAVASFCKHSFVNTQT